MLPAALGHLGSGWILNAAPSRQLAGHAGGGDLLVADLGPDATTHEAPPGFARCTSALALVTAACANPPHHRDRNAALDVLEDLTRVSNTVVLAIGDSGMRLLAQRLTDRPGPRVVTAGEAYDADIRLMRHLWSGTHSHITVRDFDGAFHTITTTMPGRHHALATTAAFAAALALGANPAEVAGGISAHFHGLDGYLTTVGTQRHTTVLASRARHPAEIAADLTAARLLTDGTLTAILEPDGHTRTTGLARELGDALALADRVVLLPVSSPLSTVAVVDPLVAVADATSAAGVPSEQIIAWRPGPCAPSLEATCTGGSGPGDLIVVIGTGTTARGLGPRLLHHIAAPTTPVPADL
ncbi:hypothetical protein [Kitasatospora sp. Root107]|nr:hypothetical protein [Kitasatospora sp. Root107]KQV20844.1 hypothetical protein ASC99_20255 [Kitasatospora sp. Root107]